MLDHRETSRRFIRQARDELGRGDLLQASEKTWGAAAHAVKAIAIERGWRHDSHSMLFGISDRLVRETGRAEIGTLFHTASAAHKNFYEGVLSAEDVFRNIERIETLLKILDTLHPT